METMQFCAVVLLLLLTLTLALVPRRLAVDATVFRSRWLMVAGTGLLALQFLLQMRFGLRSQGVAQATMLNIFLFVPASWVLSVGVLYLQRKGNLRRSDRFVGLIAWVIVTLLLLSAHYINIRPLEFNGIELPIEEVLASLVYLAMQCHYTYRHFRELRRMHRMLDNYYDRDMSELLCSMERAVKVLAILAVLAPQAIFNSGWLLGIFGLCFLLGIYYFVFSFVCYVVSSDAQHVMLAEQHNDEEKPEEKAPVAEMGDDERQRIGSAVNRWIRQEKHLRNGLTIQAAADEMKIPRYQLSAWLKTTEHELFSPWLTYLRIEAAKNLMIAHPDWSNDVIAERCGFGSRSYFQTVFRKHTGMTPVEFVEQNAR